MSDSSNICLSCGICCDGTLIGFVELEKAEIPAIKKLMDIEEGNGKGFILEPCKSFCNGCTIYAQRPKNCGDFNCGLLISVEQKEIAFNTAVETITDVKERKRAIEKKIALLPFQLKSPSFHFKMVELNRLLQKSKIDLSITKDQNELLADIHELDGLFSAKFGVSLY
jgi:hypothetical protein